MERGRIVSMDLIERALLGSTHIDLTLKEQDSVQLNVMLKDLDTDWFNFMPTEFFMSKVIEEIGEYREALNSYYINRGKYGEEVTNSLRKAVIGELSDIVLSQASALSENKIAVEKVFENIEGIKNFSLQLADKFKEESFLNSVTPTELFEANYIKTKELVDAKNIYRKCIYLDRSSKWFVMLLKLHTLEELIDPVNKMKIVKEIRRMKFAIDYFSK